MEVRPMEALAVFCRFGKIEQGNHSKHPQNKNDTPPKTNMEPENGPLEKEIPFGNHPFQVPC